MRYTETSLAIVEYELNNLFHQKKVIIERIEELTKIRTRIMDELIIEQLEEEQKGEDIHDRV